LIISFLCTFVEVSNSWSVFSSSLFKILIVEFGDDTKFFINCCITSTLNCSTWLCAIGSSLKPVLWKVSRICVNLSSPPKPVLYTGVRVWPERLLVTNCFDDSLTCLINLLFQRWMLKLCLVKKRH